MSYVVTEFCLGCIDRSCVSVCPSHCFYLAPLITRCALLGVISAGRDDIAENAGMLMIHPDECTSCGACETECPVEAIFEDGSTPIELWPWIAANAQYTKSLSGERKVRMREHST